VLQTLSSALTCPLFQTFGATPDLVFGSRLAVGDVKYKLTDGGWNRPDLYEVVAFAAAFQCQDATLICFADQARTPQSVGVGRIWVSQMVWNCAINPERAATELCNEMRSWTDGVVRRMPNLQTLLLEQTDPPRNRCK
jgi:hypothetical protein